MRPDPTGIVKNDMKNSGTFKRDPEGMVSRIDGYSGRPGECCSTTPVSISLLLATPCIHGTRNCARVRPRPFGSSSSPASSRDRCLHHRPAPNTWRTRSNCGRPAAWTVASKVPTPTWAAANTPAARRRMPLLCSPGPSGFRLTPAADAWSLRVAGCGLPVVDGRIITGAKPPGCLEASLLRCSDTPPATRNRQPATGKPATAPPEHMIVAAQPHPPGRLSVCPSSSNKVCLLLRISLNKTTHERKEPGAHGGKRRVAAYPRRMAATLRQLRPATASASNTTSSARIRNSIGAAPSTPTAWKFVSTSRAAAGCASARR